MYCFIQHDHTHTHTYEIHHKLSPNAVTKLPSPASSLSVESRLNLGMGHGKDLLFPNNLTRAGAMTVWCVGTWTRHWHVSSQLKNCSFCSFFSFSVLVVSKTCRLPLLCCLIFSTIFYWLARWKASALCCSGWANKQNWIAGDHKLKWIDFVVCLFICVDVSF